MRSPRRDAANSTGLAAFCASGETVAVRWVVGYGDGGGMRFVPPNPPVPPVLLLGQSPVLLSGVQESMGWGLANAAPHSAKVAVKRHHSVFAG